MYVHEKMNDLSNCAQDAAQACACMASAQKPNLRERLEALRNMTAEATQQAYGIHDCLFGVGGLNGDTDVEKEPESIDTAVDWLGRRLNELVGVLRERNLRERIADAKRRVWELWGPGCERFSFDPVENEIVEALCSLVELAAAGTIRSTTIQTVDHGKASISVSTKGTIKVARIEARDCQLEA